ncbi:protogenin B [Gadus morhua]|uniref:protogenin B n=1 Tax=Gadus morhua TaxID=8049 RepID=UPI0011B35893|nr:protogenin B-like [Gadus morhua]
MAKFKMKTFRLRVFFVWCFFPLSSVLCFSELSFITEPSDITVLPKDSAVLDCLAHGQPPVTMKWLKNGVPMAASEHAQFLPNGSLYIPTVKNDRGDSDEGFYQCLSQNKYGAILSQRSRLTIASISEFLAHPVPAGVSEGSVARFWCAVAASPQATITWELNQSLLPLETDRITILPNGVLQIQKARLEDTGQYRCVATNIGNRMKSKEATLTVHQGTAPKSRQKPRIIAGPQNVTAAMHQTVVLECVATGNPQPIISWSRADSKPIDVYNAKVLGSGNLVLTDVKPQHSGIYLCRATTPGTRNHTLAYASLTVMVRPSIVERPESQTRPRAGTARFMCQAEGVPQPRISWLKNGQKVHLNGRIKMYNSKLVITQIIPEDDAIYQCVAESEYGMVLSLARLIVVMSEDRPSAPRNVHAETISSSAILLAWERPLYNANKVIAYSIHYMKAEGLNNEELQAVIGNDTTSYIIEDLEPARNYTFYIVAYMPMGASRMSDQVSQHTLEDVPLRTPELSLTSRNTSDIQVGWQPLPAKLSRGRVSAYRLSYRTAADPDVTAVDLPRNATEHHLDHLEPDTIYLLRIAVATRVGWCEPSAWTSHRTPRVSSSKVPAAPLLHLEPLNCTSVIARWQTAPGSVVVQGYRLSHHEEGLPEQPSVQLPALLSHYTISGLDPRTKYHVKLLAFSQLGDGYQSDQTISTPGCVSVRDHLSSVPPAPSHVTITANGSSSVVVRWSRPAFMAGKALSFSVRCTPVGTHNATAVRYLQTIKQNMTVRNLSPNTRYEFVVRLQLDQMSSPWSSVVYHQTPAAAPTQPPLAVRMTLIEDDTVLVSWREPADPLLVVTHYTLLYASQKGWLAGRWMILQRDGSNTMALLEKLEPGNIYLVKICAANQFGEGPYSSLVDVALPRASGHRSKTPRHSDSFPETPAHSNSIYHIDQRSMTGIIVGVCIALSCIVLCAFILINKGRSRKPSGRKMVSVLSGDGAQAGGQPPSENAEVLVPMMRPPFIDAKGGPSRLLSPSGPLHSATRTKKWRLFSREKQNPNISDAEKRACLYEAGKTVLRYEERPGSAALPPFSREIIFGPQPHQDQPPESWHTGEGSQETADSGHYSQEETSSSSSGSSHGPAEPPFSRPADGPAVVAVVGELTPSLRVEDNKIEICALPHWPPEALMVSLPSVFPPHPAGS